MRIKLREFRKSHGLKMAQLAKEIGVSSGMISDIENGKSKNPTIWTVLKLADYFEVPIEELIDRNDSEGETIK